MIFFSKLDDFFSNLDKSQKKSYKSTLTADYLRRPPRLLPSAPLTSIPPSLSLSPHRPTCGSRLPCRLPLPSLHDCDWESQRKNTSKTSSTRGRKLLFLLGVGPPSCVSAQEILLRCLPAFYH